MAAFHDAPDLRELIEGRETRQHRLLRRQPVFVGTCYLVDPHPLELFWSVQIPSASLA